jgi:hypothetical protein
MKKKSRRGKVKPLSNAGPEPPRVEALLAQILLHVMGDAGQKKKALALRHAGLSNAAIATLMGTRPEVIGQVLYLARRERGAGVSKKRTTKRPRR